MSDNPDKGPNRPRLIVCKDTSNILPTLRMLKPTATMTHFLQNVRLIPTRTYLMIVLLHVGQAFTHMSLWRPKLFKP